MGTADRTVRWPVGKPIPQKTAAAWFDESAPKVDGERERDGQSDDSETRGTSGVVRLGAFQLLRTYEDGTSERAFVAIKQIRVASVEQGTEAMNEYTVHREVYTSLPPEARGYFTEPLEMEPLPCSEFEEGQLLGPATGVLKGVTLPNAMVFADSDEEDDDAEAESEDGDGSPSKPPPRKRYTCASNTTDGLIYLVQTWACAREYELRTLREFLQFGPGDPEPPALKQGSLIKIGNDIGKALKYCHRTGYTHDDLYSRNVIVCEAPAGSARDRYSAKLIDFGRALRIQWDPILDQRIEPDGTRTPVYEMFALDTIRLLGEWQRYAPSSKELLAAAIEVGYGLADGQSKPASPHMRAPAPSGDQEPVELE